MNNSNTPHNSSNRILFYTIFAMLAMAIFIAVSFYKAQLKLFQDKELHKLDCIASAVSYKIDAAEYAALINKYPSAAHADSASLDPAYQKIKTQMDMARMMNKIEEDWHTVAYDSTLNHFLFGVNVGERPLWGMSFDEHPPDFQKRYQEGGVIDHPYETEDGTLLSALSPIVGADGKVVAVLKVDERFDSFIGVAQDQIFFNLSVMLCVIAFIGTLMFLSVKSILRRQERLAIERQEVEDLRQELIANVSHDLRTPLASIHGYIETILMKKDNLDEERLEKYLNTTLRSTDKLRKLVDELFELSKLQSNERKLNPEPLAINELIHDVVNEFRIDANEKQVEIEAKTDQSLPQVKADIALIDRVLQNLIQNSIKFCSEGHKITVSAHSGGDHVAICVHDTGAGISQEDLPHIFDRFHKGQGKKSGTGLGLAIVRNILELHNAHYDVKSRVGEGTSFTFYLPIGGASSSES